MKLFTAWLHIHTSRGAGHTQLDITRILTCVQLWNVPLLCTFATFSPVTVSLLKGLISSLNFLAEKKDLSLPLFWLHEGKMAGSVPSAFTARIETPVVPAHTRPVSSIWHQSQRNSERSADVFCLGTYLSWYSPVLTPSGQEPLWGYELSSLSCQFLCNIP